MRSLLAFLPLFLMVIVLMAEAREVSELIEPEGPEGKPNFGVNLLIIDIFGLAKVMTGY